MQTRADRRPEGCQNLIGRATNLKDGNILFHVYICHLSVLATKQLRLQSQPHRKEAILTEVISKCPTKRSENVIEL